MSKGIGRRGGRPSVGTPATRYNTSGSSPRRRSGAGSWEKYSASTDRDTGLNQTNFFSGTVGETNQKKKVHVAIDEYGNVVFVRDENGIVLYDKKNGIGHLPHDLNWSRY